MCRESLPTLKGEYKILEETLSSDYVQYSRDLSYYTFGKYTLTLCTVEKWRKKIITRGGAISGERGVIQARWN